MKTNRNFCKIIKKKYLFLRESDSFLLILGLDITMGHRQITLFEQALISHIQMEGGLGRHSATFESLKMLTGKNAF